MTTEVEQAQDLYNRLKPAAVHSARSYVLTRTPHYLQDEMIPIIDADIPPVDAPTVIDAPFVGQTGSGVGSTLNCTLGNWNGAPTARTYTWQKDGVTVGTNSPTYTLIAGDATHSFDCVMVATNGVGSSAPVTSNVVVAA